MTDRHLAHQRAILMARRRNRRLTAFVDASIVAILAIIVLFMGMLLTACAAPLAPSITATAPDGTLWYVCATSPRAYTNGITRDRYLSPVPCPATPIR